MKKIPHKCPVCKKYDFPFESSFEFCKVCGWQDDSYQEAFPDEDCLANVMSLNEAREAYAKGKPIE